MYGIEASSLVNFRSLNNSSKEVYHGGSCIASVRHKRSRLDLKLFSVLLETVNCGSEFQSYHYQLAEKCYYVDLFIKCCIGQFLAVA